MDATVREYLKKRRRQLDIPYKQVAYLFGCNESTVRNYINGHGPFLCYPKLKHLIKLSGLLKFKLIIVNGEMLIQDQKEGESIETDLVSREL